MLTAKIIDVQHKEDINIKNEPFPLWGRMVPSYDGENWSYSVREFSPEERDEMCFPDENYDFDEMSRNSVFVGAYDGEACVGLAILQEGFFKYMYLYDLKVCAARRGQGVATALMEQAKKIATERGYRGIYTIGQDNNLSACLFYLKAGFRIGGLDTEVYKGTKQEGKRDILFYLDKQGRNSGIEMVRRQPTCE